MKKVLIYTNDEKTEYQINRQLEGYEIIKSSLGLSDYRMMENRYNPNVVIIDSLILHEAYNYLDLIIKDNVIVAVLNRQIETGPYYNYINLPNFILLDYRHIESLGEIIPISIKLNDIIVQKNQQICNYKNKILEDSMVKKAKLSLMKKGMSEEDSYKYILDYSMQNRITKLQAATQILESLN